MNLMLALTCNLPFGFVGHASLLLVIFGFVVCMLIIKQVSRYQRAKMWHETARIALEKGQPLPENPPGAAFDRRRFDDRFDRCGRWGDRRHRTWHHLSSGLTLIAVGIALYYALPPSGKMWALLPACVGAAKLVTWIIFLALRSNDSDDRRDPPSQT